MRLTGVRNAVAAVVVVEASSLGRRRRGSKKYSTLALPVTTSTDVGREVFAVVVVVMKCVDRFRCHLFVRLWCVWTERSGYF